MADQVLMYKAVDELSDQECDDVRCKILEEFRGKRSFCDVSKKYNISVPILSQWQMIDRLKDIEQVCIQFFDFNVVFLI